MRILIDSFLGSVISSSILIIIVLVLRMFLTKVPKKYTYLLWLLVLLKLFMPFTIELTNESRSLTTISRQVQYVEEVSIQNISQISSISFDDDNQMDGKGVGQSFTITLKSIWLLGFALLVAHSIISYKVFSKKLTQSIYIEDNIYISNEIKTAFILGVFSPKIFLPKGLSPTERMHILNHERTHLSRLDYIVKPIFYCMVLIYWFNPLMWVAYHLFMKDMEMSCDEMATKDYKVSEKQSYSFTLLSVSTKNQTLSIPLAFSESETKSRIKNVLIKKKFRPLLVFGSFVGAFLIIFFTTTAIAPKGDSNHQINSLFDEKILYIGDTVNVNKIARSVLSDFQFDYIKLKTANRPYELIIRYDQGLSNYSFYDLRVLEEKLYLFYGLIENVDVVKVDTDLGGISTSRVELVKTIGYDPYGLQSVIDYEAFAKDPLGDGSDEKLASCYATRDFVKKVTVVPVENGIEVKWDFHEDYCEDYIDDYKIVLTNTSRGLVEEIILPSYYRQFIFYDSKHHPESWSYKSEIGLIDEEFYEVQVYFNSDYSNIKLYSSSFNYSENWRKQ